jgi:hypothetical protein
MLEDQLLEVKERPLVVDFLSDLNHRSPGVLRRQSGALGALRTGDDVLDFEDLLQNGGGEDLRADVGSAPSQEEEKERRKERTSF